MKTYSTKKTLITFLFAFTLMPGFLSAQSSSSSGSGGINPSNLIRGGKEDGEALLTAYMGPFFKAFGANLNSGWYNTARPHGSFWFDITAYATVAFIPTSDQSFDINSLGLKYLKPVGPNTIAPTVFGKNEDGPQVQLMSKNPVNGKDTALASFKTPPGIGISIMPLVMPQFAVGIYKNTELMVRYFPKKDFNGASVGFIGFGVKHDIKQWIPKLKERNFDLSAMFGYSSFSSEIAMDVQPSSTAVQTGASYAGQKLSVDVSAWTLNAIISKQLSVLTLYGGLGFASSTSKVNLTGLYPVSTVESNPSSSNFGKEVVLDMRDPVGLSISDNGFRVNAGFRLKLLVLTIHADYTLAKYSVASAGVGLNIDFAKKKKPSDAGTPAPETK